MTLRFALPPALVGVALAALPAAADLAEVRQRGALRVLVMPAPDEAHFFNTGDGEPGFDREILSGFTHLHDLSLERARAE